MNQQNYLLSDEKLAQIAAGKMWDFHGGVHPQENKIQSSATAIEDAGIPEELIIAVEYKGKTPELLVKIGDQVTTGQPLTKVYGAFVVQHASSSGTVTAIEPRPDCHPSGLPVMSVVIKTDGLDTPYPQQGFDDYQQAIPAQLIEAIQQAGIVGLGGAGFPTHLKLGQQDNRLLIINAIECEPYITADDRLTQEYAQQIILGTQILQHILKPRLTVFAIEDNKTEAIAIFKQALQTLTPEQQKIFILKVVPTRYPSGSAKQLIEILTGEQTPIGKHASQLGVVMQNVGTVFAVKEAIIDGKPLLSRVVTLTGNAFAKKGNAWVRIGTPMQYLLERYQYQDQKKQSAQQKLIVGGPMMGFTANSPMMPVSKICNCLLAPTVKEMPPAQPEMNCIRCGECADACPAELLPQQLLWYSKSEDHKKLQEYDLSACIECGACAYVCPSHIPLVEYYRVSKAQIASSQEEANKAALARQRHENRLQRLEKEKQERQLKHKQAAQKRIQQSKTANDGEDLIAAALARAKAKKQANEATQHEDKATAPNSQVAAAIARAKAKKQAKQNESAKITAEPKTEQDTEAQKDPKKAVVAAAIARAKAKKLAKQNDNAEITTEPKAEKDAEDTEDPKKAAVAAAIARAKAKKLAKQAEQTQGTEPKAQLDAETAEDPKKAAVAAAIARAKAKKLAKQAEQTQSTEPKTEQDAEATEDPKKAAVTAAIARAKAKKLAKQAEQTQGTEPKTEQDAEATEDPKKAAVAAAIARAKAKKLAKQAEQTQSSEPKTEQDAEATEDPKKAAVAAAIARAKAKKLAKQAEQNQQSPQDESLPDNSEVIKQRQARKEQARLHKLNKQPEQINSEEQSASKSQATDNKKAAIAKAIAKAKAKKLAEKDQ